MDTDSLRASLSLLATRRYGTFWFASLLSNIGTWAQQVAEPWLLLNLGASATLVGLDTFMLSAPSWLLTVPGGLLADHADRRRVIAIFQSAQMLCPVIIVALLILGVAKPWMILSLALIVGITDALSMPSFASIVPMIVEPAQIGAGLALNSTQFNLSRVLGPALAAVLMATVGAIGCFVVSALSYVPFIGVALWILPSDRLVRNSDATEVAARPLDGLRVVARLPALRGALYTAFYSGLLCAPIVTFCPVLVKSAFAGSAGDFSLTIGAFGVGGILGAAGLLAVNPLQDRRRLSSGFAIAYGIAVVGAAVAPSILILVVTLVLSGAFMSITNTSANTLVQSVAPAESRGRAVSLFMLAMRGGMALGSLITGFSVTLLGVREALLLNGVVAVGVQLVVGWRWSRAMNGQLPPG